MERRMLLHLILSNEERIDVVRSAQRRRLAAHSPLSPPAGGIEPAGKTEKHNRSCAHGRHPGPPQVQPSYTAPPGRRYPYGLYGTRNPAAQYHTKHYMYRIILFTVQNNVPYLSHLPPGAQGGARLNAGPQ